MGLFKRKDNNRVNSSSNSIGNSDREQYGKAWLMIVGQREKQKGLDIMTALHNKGFHEATVVLAMFSENQNQRKALVKQAADAGNVEGIWEYCGLLPHSYCPDPSNSQDALWENYCLKAAEGGSVDAMNEMGNIFNRRSHYAESMYWYAMANSSGQNDGMISLSAIAHKWAMAGCPYPFQSGSPKFDISRHKCSIAYLELHAGKQLSVSPDELIRLVNDGVPIAAYLAGDLFEANGNYEMAYRMYNSIAFTNDAHGLKCYADMLFTGRGVKADMQGAARFYQMAAEGGDRESMFTMGEFTKNTNKYLAAYWYGLSHTRGFEHGLTRLIQLTNQ